MRRSWIAFAAVLGPGLLAGLSDDDPAGIATYSILGAEYGYELLWVLAIATVSLVVFHELAVRIGVVTGQGLMGLIRDRYGVRWAAFALVALVIANVGTTMAEFAGIAAGAELLGLSRLAAVPFAALGVALLVLRGRFHRIEHVLLALSAVLVAYVGAGLIAGPDWGAAAQGAVVPRMDMTTAALFAVTATIGTTLAPWGLSFIQSYAVDKRLTPGDLRWERVDVIAGAVMTGVIGAFVVIACAETLHPAGQSVDTAADAARALRPLAGDAAALLFAAGLVGAGLLAAAILPLSTAYSVSEAFGYEAALDDPVREAPVFYGTYAFVLAAGALVVLIPSVPLVPVLFFTQALNAVLLLPLLVFLIALGRTPAVMGEHRTGRAGLVAAVLSTAVVAASVLALGLALAL